MTTPDLLISWWTVAAVYGAASLVTFAAYGIDKALAGSGKRRVPERTLHGLELCGGWPGALLGMRAFRHKTAKTSFRVVTFVIVALHAAAWTLYFTRSP